MYMYIGRGYPMYIGEGVPYVHFLAEIVTR